MEILLYILLLIAGLAGGFFIAKILEKNNASSLLKDAKNNAASIIKDANSEAETVRKDKILQAKEKFLELKSEH